MDDQTRRCGLTLKQVLVLAHSIQACGVIATMLAACFLVVLAPKATSSLCDTFNAVVKPVRAII